MAFVDVGPSRAEAEILDAFDAAIDERTRLVAVSHVLWATGRVLPIARIAELAHARGAVLAVDGAQAAGAIPVDVAALGADLYAISAQKWLLGPEGMGALAVAPAVARPARPIVGRSLHVRVGRLGRDGGSLARRPRVRELNFHRPSIVGMARSIGWLSMFVGLDWVYERGPEMAAHAADRLAAIEGSRS